MYLSCPKVPNLIKEIHTLLNIPIKSSSFVPKMFRRRIFYLNINIKITSSEGVGIVWVGDKEICAYVLLYSNKVLDWK